MSVPPLCLQGRSLAEAFDQHALQRNVRQHDAFAEPAESATRSVRKVHPT